MRVHLREDRVTPAHTTLRLFIDSGSCGLVTMRTEEAVAMRTIMERGCAEAGHAFQYTTTHSTRHSPHERNG